jgi:Zn-dependent M16 (insulinase) family peptidase
MPIKLPGGRTLSWEEVSRKIDIDLTGTAVSVVHEGIWISLTALKEDYSKAISWLSDFLYGTIFDIERLKNLVNTKLEVLPSLKEDGSGIASCAIGSLCSSHAR